MKTPESVLGYAVQYLKIFSFGLPALSIYNFGAAILRGIGNSRLPIVALMIFGIINVVLNTVTICFFHLGIFGVALATVIANTTSAIIIVITIKRKLKVYKKQLVQKSRTILKTIKYGLPVGLQGMVFALSNMIIQSAINSFGKEAIAGVTIVFNFECIGYYVIDSFNQASISFTSQNYKSEMYGRCKKNIYFFAFIRCTWMLIYKYFFLS